MCVNSDGDFDKTLNNTKYLVKQLMLQFPNAQIVRHYDASRKNCPASLNYDDWSGWYVFLGDIGLGDATPSALLKKGSYGDAVTSLQESLNVLGYTLNADGDFGGITENAVIHFQQNNSLEVDGIVGPSTQAKLDEMVSKLDSTPSILAGIAIAFSKGYITMKDYWTERANADADIGQLFLNICKKG